MFPLVFNLTSDIAIKQEKDMKGMGGKSQIATICVLCDLVYRKFKDSTKIY